MNILLTNDDGINARGIQVLFAVLSTKHNVYMFAPKTEKSACSNAITITHDIRVDFAGDRQFAIHGYPVDCVNIGVHGDLCPDIDLVVSGINHGPNVGDDVHYSGTVAAARSGFIFGRSALAVSINTHQPSRNLEACAYYILSFIDSHALMKSETPVFININYPDLPRNEIAGVKMTRQGRRSYVDTYSIMEKGASHVILKLEGESISDFTKNTDTGEIHRNFITVTPLQLDTTHYSLLKKLEYEE